MKKMRTFLLGLVTFGLLLSSCTNLGKDQQSSETTPEEDQLAFEVLSSWDPNVVITHNENLNLEFDEMTPLSPENQERLSSTMFDVPRNSSLKMHFTEGAPDHLSCLNVVNNHPYYLSVTDVVNKTFKTTLPLSTDGNLVSLKFDESFLYGRVYRIELQDDSYLQFEGKDSTIRSLVVEMEDDPHDASEYDICHRKANVPTLDLNKVTEEQTEENAILSFVYSDEIPELTKGDIFLVKAGSNGDDLGIADFYGIFESKEQVNGKWKVYYSEPSGEDIFDEYRQKGFKPADLTDAKISLTRSYIQDQFRYSSTARGLVAFFSKQGETTDVRQLTTMFEHLVLRFDFNYYNNVLDLKFTIGAQKIPLRENLYLSICYVFDVKNNYNVDYDVSLKKEWGIPVGIDYKVKCIQDKIESHSLLVSVTYERDTPEQDEDEVQSSLIEELRKAKNSQDNFFKKIKDSAEACAQTEGNKTTIPILKIPFTIAGGMIFEIRLDLSFDFTIQAMLLIRKQVKSQDVVFNFSSEGGGDSSQATKVEGSNTWDIYFMGLIEFKLALKLAIAWYFVGTYKWFHVEGYGEVWIKVGLQGSFMASFNVDADEDTFSGSLSIDFYVMFGVDVGLDLAMVIYDMKISKPLFKDYILRIYMCNEVEHYSENTDTRIEMVNKTKDNINNYDILNFVVWDGVYMVMDSKKFKADDRKSIITLFGQEIVGVYMFQFTPENESLLKISQDGEITIPDGTPAEFTTHFTIHLSNWISFVQDREIEVYFNAPDAHHVYMHEYVDGVETGAVTDGGRYRPTAEYVFPDPPEKTGYKFLGYAIGDTEYAPGDKVTMPAEDLDIKIKWHKIIYYQVYFLDGKGNIIYVDDHVEEQTAAKEPSAAIRDQFMEGYKFIGWDKNFSCVNSNMIVRGIYVKVGD